MSNYSRILLFYDETEEAKTALIRCANLSASLSALVDVVTVVDYIAASAITAGMLSGVLVSQMEEDARSVLKNAVDELGLNGVVARGHVAFGPTVDAILRMIERLNSDLIVVGHRTKTGLARWYGARPLHIDLVERLKGATIVTVTPD
ncbi:universal stress protein [Paraburkholderia flagellata]|uniref:universal stress protein n=1 Tax=Paraburkholderia flagellata TaxID=2883241 RepID=UPI001F2C47E9|nr:universal stress protein [Paraburkholderia flagellata]